MHQFNYAQDIIQRDFYYLSCDTSINIKYGIGKCYLVLFESVSLRAYLYNCIQLWNGPVLF